MKAVTISLLIMLAIAAMLCNGCSSDTPNNRVRVTATGQWSIGVGSAGKL